MISTKHFINHRLYSILLSVSILFFTIKGIQYAVIGSYIPPIFIGMIILLFSYSYKKSVIAFKRTLKFWATILLLWAFSRIVVQIMFCFSDKITETHIREQFTLIQNLLTFLILFIGIYLLRKRSHFVNNSV